MEMPGVQIQLHKAAVDVTHLRMVLRGARIKKFMVDLGSREAFGTLRFTKEIVKGAALSEKTV